MGQLLALEAINSHEALHNPGELAVLMHLLDARLPTTILEIGTWAGGSAWAWSRMKSVKQIVTVDIAQRKGTAERLDSLPCRVSQIIGDSMHGETLRQVNSALDGQAPDVLVIDGAHEYKAARHDWDTYAPLVPAGGLVVLHDTQGYPGNDTVQVPKLWAELRQVYRTTELVDVAGGPGGTGIVWL